MKCVWISPEGASLDVAERIRAAGHQVVGYGLAGSLPSVQRGQLAHFCTHADLVVIDGPFKLERTAKSWKPSQESLFIDELRRYHNVVALGPTPTIDLLVGDRRYLRKTCSRFGIPYERESPADAETFDSGGWFRGKQVIPDGPYLRFLVPLFKSVGFKGWLELTGHYADGIALVTGCRATWPSASIPEGREYEFLKGLSDERG